MWEAKALNPKNLNKMAKLKDYNIVPYPEKKSFLEDLLIGTQDKMQISGIKDLIGIDEWGALQQFKTIKQMMGHPQTRLPIFVGNHP